MISSQFKRDYRQMVEQGVTFTPDDIVRLNALAVKVRLSQRSAQTVHLPRVAFVGDLTLREPTIAHELWIEEAARWIDTSDERNFIWLHGYALSQDAEKLVDAFDPEKLVKTVFEFAAKRLCSLTREQLSAAVDYALFGADWTVGESGPRKRADETEKKDASLHVAVAENPSPTIGLLVNARALRIPITLDEARRMTVSELNEVIMRALVHDREYNFKNAENEAFAEYVRAREEIRERSTRTREAAPSEQTDRK